MLALNHIPLVCSRLQSERCLLVRLHAAWLSTSQVQVVWRAMKGAASGVVGELARARIALDERGQKLGELEERTAAMMASADSFSKHAHDVRRSLAIHHDCCFLKWYRGCVSKLSEHISVPPGLCNHRNNVIVPCKQWFSYSVFLSFSNSNINILKDIFTWDA